MQRTSLLMRLSVLSAADASGIKSEMVLLLSRILFNSFCLTHFSTSLKASAPMAFLNSFTSSINFLSVPTLSLIDSLSGLTSWSSLLMKDATKLQTAVSIECLSIAFKEEPKMLLTTSTSFF